LVGVGSGRHIPPLSAAGFDVDVLEEDAGRASRAAERFGRVEGLRVFHGSYRNPPDSFSGYDGALSTHALLHGSPAQISSALAATGGTLREGALFHLTLGSAKDPRYGRGAMLDDFTWAEETGPERGVAHAFFDVVAASALLAGWNVLELDERSAAETAGLWTHSPAETATIVHWFVRLQRPYVPIKSDIGLEAEA